MRLGFPFFGIRPGSNHPATFRAARLVVLALATLYLARTPAAVAVPINITYTDSPGEGFNDPTLGGARRNAFEAAAAHWAQLLPGTIPVIITASMDPLPGNATAAILGSAGPTTFFTDAQGLPRSGVFYPVALANQLTQQDLNQSQPEITAQFNSSVDNDVVLGTRKFYYGLDGQPGSDIDFFSVVLHEFGHGLGFIDSINQDGSFSLNNQPDAYDFFLANGPALGATRLSALSPSARAAVLISNALFFAGPNANAAGGGTNARIFAPNPYEPGSSTGHLDEATYHGINELMTPVATEVAHDPGSVALGIFHDLGWSAGAATPTPTVAGPTPTPTPPANPGPPNDNFVNAQVIAGGSGRVTGTNVHATKEAGEPSHSPDGNPGGASVWYRWTAPANGTATFNTTGSGFDTIMAIYTGGAVGALSGLPNGKNNNLPGVTAGPSQVVVAVSGGTSYSIAVDGFNPGITPNQGSIVLNWSLAASGPANDNFAAAQAISGTAGRVTGSNVNATKEAGEPSHGGNAGGTSVWYRWTAPNTGLATFTTAGSNFNTLLAVYTGTAVSALHLVGGNDNAGTTITTSAVTFTTVAGTVYRVAVDGFKTTAAASGSVVLNWTSGPANDVFANAQLISGSSGRVTGTNVNATKETGEPSHSPDNNRGGKSVWYRWVATATGRFTFNTGGSSFDTVLAIYTGNAVNALTPLPGGKNDDVSISSFTSAVTVSVVKGTTYRIAVDGFTTSSSATGAASGNIVLNWTPAAALVVRDLPLLRSAATLSTATADAVTGLIRLRFSLPLDAEFASDAPAYTLVVNGRAVPVASASYAADNNTVTLATTEGALRFGDAVTVRWTYLQDVKGRVLSGQSSPLIAR